MCLQIEIPNLTANFSAPKEEETQRYKQPITRLIPIQMTVKVIGNTIPSNLTSASSTDNRTTTFSNLTVTLLPWTLTDIFRDIWSTYGQVISLVGGGFAAGAAALFFNRAFKTNKPNGI
jgi:hypothetical protein